MPNAEVSSPWVHGDDTHVSSYDCLASPALLQYEMPAPRSSLATASRGREDAVSILSRADDRLLVICGPCSIHDPQAATKYARKLKTLAKTLESDVCIVMRACLEKPRAVVGWKGLVSDTDLDSTFRIKKGLRTSRQLFSDITALGMPIATDLMDTISPQYLAEFVSLGVIGTRDTESQLHRELASGVPFPVGYKSGTDGDVEIAIDAMQAASQGHDFIGATKEGLVAIVHSVGNPDGFVLLRAGKSGPNYDAASVAAVKRALSKRGERENVVIDCSHGNSSKDHPRQPIAANSVAENISAGDHGIVGVMLESNLNEGRQSVPASGPFTLKEGVSITDACVGWDSTVEILETLARAVRQRRCL